uniref:Uncharacterized protein n=1 Tax=Picea glauca TaxID=3330 RepID=A0A101M3A7_PICGL|nr:hypothetical protein ABT39_MTgene119 [Picea glauca]
MDWDFYLRCHLSSFYGGFDSCVLSSGLYRFRDDYYSHGSRTYLSHRGSQLGRGSHFLLLCVHTPAIGIRILAFGLMTLVAGGLLLATYCRFEGIDFLICVCVLFFMICVIDFMRWMKHFMFCGIHLRFRVRDLFFISDSGCHFVFLVLGRVSLLPISTSICAQAYPLFPIVASRTVV